MNASKVCLGPKLKYSRSVRCIPLRYNWTDFTKDERALLADAEKIYFPTCHYAAALSCTGRKIFPSLFSYMLLGDKIRQLHAFMAASVPMPRTMLFKGPDRKKSILSRFSYPFVAKVPVGSSRGTGVFLIGGETDLEAYLTLVSTAYVQEYVPMNRDIRVVVIGRRAVLSYWKVAAPGSFRTNVAQGACIELDSVPAEAVELAVETASRCGIDHAGFDICISDRGPLILEANIHFGREGFEEAGLSYLRLLAKMADSGEI